MRIFLAGATGVIGARLLPLMLSEGHNVAAVTRTQEKLDALRAAGAKPILCDVFDRIALNAAVSDFQPDLIVHQVTDLPDEAGRIPEFKAANNRVRSEGTQNLLAAAKMAKAARFLAQSVAWSGGPIVDAHENAVVVSGGTILRYGQFHGPGTYFENEPPAPPRIHIDVAARRTMSFLAGPPGIFLITDADSSS